MRAGRLARQLAGTGLALALTGLTGCAQQPRPLYHWGAYQAQVYEHFKGTSSSPLTQYGVLSTQLQKTVDTGGSVPPGLHAHLGLLQIKLGQNDQAMAHFEAEKRLFPESGPYIDWLLKRSKAEKS